MKKKWWQYFTYLGGGSFFMVFGFGRYLPDWLWFAFFILGVITTAVYFFMQQGQRPEDRY